MPQTEFVKLCPWMFYNPIVAIAAAGVILSFLFKVRLLLQPREAVEGNRGRVRVQVNLLLVLNIK